MRIARHGDTGMGVKFVRTLAEDRSRLNKFLNEQLKAAEIQPGRLTIDAALNPPMSEVLMRSGRDRLLGLFRKIDGNSRLCINRYAILDVWVVAPRFDRSQGYIA